MDIQEIQKFDLPSVVDVDSMDAMREALVGAIETGNTILDAAKVSRVATNALLMLVSAGQGAKSHNFTLSIVNPSEAFCEAVERLGMDQVFAEYIEGN